MLRQQRSRVILVVSQATERELVHRTWRRSSMALELSAAPRTAAEGSRPRGPGPVSDPGWGWEEGIHQAGKDEHHG